MLQIVIHYFQIFMENLKMIACYTAENICKFLVAEVTLAFFLTIMYKFPKFKQKSLATLIQQNTFIFKYQTKEKVAK